MYVIRVPTRTGKTWKNGKTFSSQGKVRGFCADWKSQGNFDKILEKSGKFREFLFFVLFLIELYLLKWIKFSVFRPTWWVSSVGYPIWGKLGVLQPVPVVLVQIVYWVYC